MRIYQTELASTALKFTFKSVQNKRDKNINKVGL
jgi:hypothetical protein